MTKHDLWLLQRFLSTISFLESGTLPTRVGPGPGTHSRMPTGICLIAILVELGPREGARGVHPVQKCKRTVRSTSVGCSGF